MSKPSTPHPLLQINSFEINTPPPTTSLHDPKTTTPTPPSPIIQTSNPNPNPNSTNFKRKLALTLESLYDESPLALQSKIRAEKNKSELASPLWGNKTLGCISEDESISGRDEEGRIRIRIVEEVGGKGVEDIEEELVKGLDSSREMIGMSDLAEKEMEEVLEVGLELGFTGVKELGSLEIDVVSPARDDPVEVLGSVGLTTLADTQMQMREVGKTITENLKEIRIRHEWTGTCQFDRITESSINLQKENKLPTLILHHKALIHHTTLSPHDPYHPLQLSALTSHLSFPCTSTHHAHRTLYLLHTALRTLTPSQTALSLSIFTAISSRLRTSSTPLILDEITWMRKSAYRYLVQGLLHCGDFEEGLGVVESALGVFPDEGELVELKGVLVCAFEKMKMKERDEEEEEEEEEEKEEEEEEGIRNGSVESGGGHGLIYQKRYPWMASRLFVRTPSLVRGVNANFGSSNAEVRPVVFEENGAPSSFKTLGSLPKHKDVGPLGIFATRDIAEGETVLLDKSYACISDVAPSTGQFCDACHAALVPPFMFPSQILRPACGCKVSFCSKDCHGVAVNGYHKIQCGIDFSWLYSAESLQSDWEPIMFLRVICIILSTPGWSKDSIPQKNPLLHPLLARLTANYSSTDKQATNLCHWSYQDNIISPTHILLSLGLDIFSPIKKTHAGKPKLHPNIWTPELIQTIYWRMLNNANTSTINLSSTSSSSSPTSRFRQNTNTNHAHLIVLSPNYILFNHSCTNNITWKGSCFSGSENISQFTSGTGRDKKVMQPGSSSVICKARRDIAAGEELTISYLGDAMGGYTEEEYFENPRLAMGRMRNGEMSLGRLEVRVGLRKWFGGEGGGCGCLLCFEEDERGLMPGMERL